MDYKDFRLQDFLQDEYFVEWVLNPNTESAHFWEKWLINNPEKRKTIEDAREVVSSITYHEFNKLDDKEYSDILEALLKINRRKSSPSFRPPVAWVLRIAASLALLFVVYWVVWQSKPSDPKATSNTVSIVTLPGQKKSVKLPDGTLVKLNAESVLKYQVPFIQGIRSVSLSGEAFFDVVRNEDVPFTIQTGKLTTRVLGTSFNIKSYEDDQSIQVAVISGLVELSSEESNTLLKAELMGTYDKKKNQMVLTDFDVDDETGWVRGILKFKEEPLSSVFKKLERWYGVKIVADENVKLEGLYSGSYVNEPLDQILRGLSYTSHFDYTINEKKVTIYEKD